MNVAVVEPLAEVLLIVAASTATFLALAGLVGGLAPLAAAVAIVAFLRLRPSRRRDDAR